VGRTAPQALGAPALKATQVWLLSCADAVLAVSPDLVEVVRPVRPDVGRALVSSALPPPTHDAPTVRRALGLAGTQPLVLAIGRLHEQKGFDVLVDAAVLMQRDAGVTSAAPAASGIGPVIAIAGEGPRRSDLERRITAAGVDVRLLGDRGDVADLVAAADVVVMPSRWEGWPLAAAEVLGAGRPLVASAVGGLPELVGAAARLVRAGDPAALAAAITELLNDPGALTRLSALAVARAAQLPTGDDVTRSVVELYRRVLRAAT
jgi:glycosyltransferase involved in cell wall biosynthesis